jgi:tRNA C32,U32 (ribose-2'-O)-methylase TrmJ
MKNTGFSRLNLVGIDRLREKSYITAVHAGDILDSANLYSDLSQAIGDLDIIFAATAKKRKTRKGRIFPLFLWMKL